MKKDMLENICEWLAKRENHEYFLWHTVRVLNFVGKIFVFYAGKKIRGVLNFVAMAAW